MEGDSVHLAEFRQQIDAIYIDPESLDPVREVSDRALVRRDAMGSHAYV